MTTVICPYCGGNALLVTGAVIYPHRKDLAAKRFYQCAPCDAYVGCHPSGQPLGRLANMELRQAKMSAHAAFDPLWKPVGGSRARSRAYRKLAQLLGIPPSDCHIGAFDVHQCRRVVEVLKTSQQETP